jgi:hypothetical protein
MGLTMCTPSEVSLVVKASTCGVISKACTCVPNRELTRCEISRLTAASNKAISREFAGFTDCVADNAIGILQFCGNQSIGHNWARMVSLIPFLPPQQSSDVIP